MYSISSIDEEILTMNIPRNILEEVVGDSIFSGEPYMLLCRRCKKEYHVCLIIQVSPTDIEEYSILLKGLLITVSKDKPLDKLLEEIFKKTYTIKYLKEKISFYIPRIYTRTLYRYLCEGEDWREKEIKALDIKEAMIYFNEEGE
ncbi:MAG: hypothetical protein B6U89_00235 [Desulfurococcales archaeon ex4484_58]|nr:MAG: hypothetical protein B6U89_00235 [Desulfurococcales archaeon ex4484_58]